MLVIAPVALRAQGPEPLPEPMPQMNRGRQQFNNGSQFNGSQQPSGQFNGPQQYNGPQQQGAMPAQGNGQQRSVMTADNSTAEMYQDDQGPEGDGPNPDGPAYPFTSSEWWRNGCWYGEFDVLVWHHARAHDGRLGLDTSGALPGQRQDLNRHGTSLGLEPGGQGTIGYILCRDIDNRDHSVEFTYFGFNNWNSKDGLVAETPGALRSTIAPNYGGFNFADTYSTFYKSSLQSMEINYRVQNRPEKDRMLMGPDGFWSRQITPGRTQSLYVGLAGLQINEDFRWISLQDGVSPDTFSGNFHTHTDNTLLGAQIGGDCFDIHEGWFWGLRGKVGIFANFSRGLADIVVEDPNTPENPVHGHTTEQTPSGVGRLSLLTGLHLSENMTLFSSFDMMIAGGLAMAPDQVSFFSLLADHPATMNTGGRIFYNGLSFGLEAYW